MQHASTLTPNVYAHPIHFLLFQIAAVHFTRPQGEKAREQRKRLELWVRKCLNTFDWEHTKEPFVKYTPRLQAAQTDWEYFDAMEKKGKNDAVSRNASTVGHADLIMLFVKLLFDPSERSDIITWTLGEQMAFTELKVVQHPTGYFRTKRPKMRKTPVMLVLLQQGSWSQSLTILLNLTQMQ